MYCYGEPSPKKSTWQVLATFIGKLLGGKIIWMLRKAEAPSRSEALEVHPPSWRERLVTLSVRLLPVAIVHTIFLVAFSWIFGWWGYFALWAIPLATFAAFFNDFRIFCEHSLLGRDTADKNERMISFTSNPVELFFFAPNHMNFHAEHHLFPYVPHHNLPALRKAIQACPELNGAIEWRTSYVGHVIAYINRSLQPETTSNNKLETA